MPGWEILMPLWRIRVFLPDDPGSRTAVTDVRAEQPASQLRVILGAVGAATMTSDIAVELPQDDGLTAVFCSGNCGAQRPEVPTRRSARRAARLTCATPSMRHPIWSAGSAPASDT